MFGALIKHDLCYMHQSTMENRTGITKGKVQRPLQGERPVGQSCRQTKE